MLEQLEIIKNGIFDINELLKKRIMSYSDISINMKENLESLQSSSVEIDNYISLLKNDIEDEENIFFVGLANQKNINKLEEQQNLREDLEAHIISLQEAIKSEAEKIDFLENILSKLFEYNEKLSNIIEKEKELPQKEKDLLQKDLNLKNKKLDKDYLLSKLKMCQKFSMVDYERCYIELGKIIEEMEIWEKE